MVRKANIIEVKGLAGGEGSAIVHHIVSKSELYGQGRMYAKVELKPHSTVGWHQHIGETEPYYILEGEGVFIDNDESRTPVVAGDVCTILPGQYHSLENASETQNLVFMALIHNA